MTKKSNSEKIIIIGGGICSLVCAYELLQHGLDVEIYEKNTVGSGATNKSGGMLAGGIENEPSESNLWELTKYSQSLWGDFYKELEKTSGVDIDYQSQGTMMVATTNDDLSHIEFLYNYQTKLGVDVKWLNSRDVKQMEPHLKSIGGMWCKGDHQVDSIKLTSALKTAIEKLNGKIFEKSKVEKIIHNNNAANGIELSDGTTINADKIIVTNGIDAPELLKGICEIPIRPLKGQMISLKMNERLIDRVVWAPKTYLIPKSDGTLLIGATVEEQGINSDITAGGILALLESAWRVAPAIEDLPIKDIWVGHRPTARDDCPILGKLPIDNLYIADGHHRNGILLAPATGKIMTDIMVDDSHPNIIKNFTIDRFN